jgi:DNA-binding LytR/AlgR family response regulator
MKCIIIEDQLPAQRVLKKYIEDLGSLELVGTFSNALEAIQFLNKESVDLIFLDIHLPKLSGIDFLKTLPKRPKIILTTAFSEYALEGFELDVVDYLLKPFSFQRFVKAVSKASNLLDPKPDQAKGSGQMLFVKSGHDYIKINTNDIVYINSDSDYTDIYMSDANYITSESLKFWQSNLEVEKFIRVHKSYIVNLEKVLKISGNRIYLLGDNVVPIGRTYKSLIKKRFIK